MLRACSLGWWSTARPTGPRFKCIYPTFSKKWRTPHHRLYMAPMSSTRSECPYLQFLASIFFPLLSAPLKSSYSAWSRNIACCAQALPSSSLCSTAKRGTTFWSIQQYDTSNLIIFGCLVFFLFIYFVFPPNTLPPTKSKISNFPGHSAVGIPHLPTASQHPRELLMGCKPPKFSFYYCFSVWNPNTFSTQCFQWQRAAKHEGRQNHLLIHGTTRVVLGFFKAKI